MAKGIALALGLNSVNPKKYEGWSGELTACEADAKDMRQIAKSQKFGKTTLLLTKAATRSRVLAEIKSAAAALKKGDLFMLSYSGHGGQLPDKNGDEPDALDETWCLYDGELVDDQLYASFADFAAGVRILVLSDSCHSGSVVKLALHKANIIEGDAKRYRYMPQSVALRVYEAHAAEYDKVLRNKALRKKATEAKAAILLISGCQDNQLSQDGAFNGLFTGTMKQVWNAGKFTGSYIEFHKAILARMPPDQSPNLFGAGGATAAFEKSAPFRV